MIFEIASKTYDIPKYLDFTGPKSFIREYLVA